MQTTTWIHLENTVLSEISQTQKEKYFIIHLHEISRIGKFIEKERRLGITRGWGVGGMGSYCLMVTEFMFGVMKKFFK